MEIPKYFYFRVRVINKGTAIEVEDASDVDVVEVVRCKDCIHYWKNKPSDDVPVCLASPKDDAFCSEGERKEDGKIDRC